MHVIISLRFFLLQENLPIEIREVREKEAEMRRHKKTIQEKEEVIQVLEKRIDELNAQITTMQASNKASRPSKHSTITAPPPTQPNGQAEAQVDHLRSPKNISIFECLSLFFLRH